MARKIKTAEWYFLSLIISVGMTLLLIVFAASAGWLRGEVIISADGEPLIDPITRAPARDVNPLASIGGMCCMLTAGSALGPVACLFIRLATAKR
jgi:hypothetical protein